MELTQGERAAWRSGFEWGLIVGILSVFGVMLFFMWWVN